MTISFCSPKPGVVELSAPGMPTVECLMTPLEPCVYDTIAELLPTTARAAEIGCYKGGSAIVLGWGMRRRGKDLKLWCHDLFEPFEAGGTMHDIAVEFDANTTAYGCVPWLTKVQGNSRETHAVHENESLDYVFVDGDHSYEGALADLTNFWPKLKPDGLMAVQDSIGDVRHALRDWLPPDVEHVVVEPPHGHYVTVVSKDAHKIDRFKALLSVAVEGLGVGRDEI